MLKKIHIMLISIIFAVVFSFVFVSADTGPKAKTILEINGLSESSYVVVSATNSSKLGPYTQISEMELNQYNADTYELLKKINDNITLKDGYEINTCYSEHENVSSFTVTFSYFTPSPSIFVIYDLSNDTYCYSNEIYDYAFSSYYKADISNDIFHAKTDTDISNIEFNFVKNYNYTSEILGFILRLVVTLVIEMGIALLFKFKKSSYFVILGTNIVTQVGLNISLNLISYNSGKSIYMLSPYILIELGIFLVEALIYYIFVKNKDNERTFKTILYSGIANISSFVLGMILWFFI